jgi:hypothetical protein
LIVICSSYENFVRPIDYAKHPDWPQGLMRIGFSCLTQLPPLHSDFTAAPACGRDASL